MVSHGGIQFSVNAKEHFFMHELIGEWSRNDIVIKRKIEKTHETET